MVKYNPMKTMKKTLLNIAKVILNFISSQYVVLLFSLSAGIKLCFISTYVVRLTWSGWFSNSLIVSILSAILLFSPLYFVKKYKNRLATALALILSILLVIDTVYYSYFSSLPTVGLLNITGQAGDVGPAILPLIKWWIPLYFIDIAIAIAFKKPLKMWFDKLKLKSKTIFSNQITSLLVTMLTVAALLLSLPMGFNKLGEVINRGYDTVSTAQYYGVLMAHGIDLTRFIIQETVRLSDDKKTELINWVKNNQPEQIASGLNGLASGKNVIMIQVESLGSFVINQTVNDKEITPNLNTLASTSQAFLNSRFVMGAGHTSDTDFVSNTSYFPMNDAAVFVRYGQSDFTSIAKTLVQNGYSAYAYHGFNRNFWNRNVTLASLGYQKYYAADNFSHEKKINMGLNDGTFLSETADYIKEQPRPSLSYVITLTSHTPFSITDETKELGLNPDNYPNQVAGYLENINYTDRMLGKFFDKLKEDNLYDDSLIVVYGDHVPVLDSFSAGSIDYDPNSVKGKEAPLIVKLPNGEIEHQSYQNYGTHLDITPTILDLLGIETNQLMFGQSLFAKRDNICQDQLATFKIDDCQKNLEEMKYYSSMIIRYNQFNNL